MSSSEVKYRRVSSNEQSPRSRSKESETKIRLWGARVSVKWVSLVCLVFQNTALVLLMRLSRTQSGPMYLSSTAVVMAEVLKLFISIACLAYERPGDFGQHIIDELTHSDTIKLAVPGLIYTLQNNLLFVALSNLEAAVYQITYQTKILTTALMTVALLGKRLNQVQIVSLVLLSLGVALVQLAGSNSSAKKAGQNQALGLLCVITAAFTSGFAGVYTEKVLKHGPQVSLFIRNIQITVFGLFLSLIAAFVSDGKKIRSDGFFQGYNSLVWFVILFQAGGGLVIAIVMKYADNILKGFATSISIVLSAYLSTILFHFQFTSMFVIGAALVIGAVFLYSAPPDTLSSLLNKPSALVDSV